VGAALAGFTPLIATAMLTEDGAPWWIAAYMIGTCLVSLAAFLAAPR
jgi:MHS family shikimate/dehydroshikimate transporter-like MFS transporter